MDYAHGRLPPRNPNRAMQRHDRRSACECQENRAHSAIPATFAQACVQTASKMTRRASARSENLTLSSSIQRHLGNVGLMPSSTTTAALTVLATPVRDMRLEHVATANGTLADLTNACGW